jgi:sulfite reductase alpha subunit-like flavoprotein
MQKHISGDARADLEFLKNREKSAALSHIDRPRAHEVQIDLDADRSSHRFADMIKARQDDYSERQAMDRQRVDVLDRDNVLQDAPEKYLLHPADSSPPDVISSRDMLPIPYSNHATVEGNMRITPVNHWQDVRLLSLTVYDRDGNEDSPGFDLTPGSTISIYPKNVPADVDMLIDRMKWQAVADKPLVWAHSHQVSDPTLAATNRQRMPKHLYPLKDSTLRDLLTHNFDITAVPKRSFIQEIAYFASDAREQERLRELVKPGNSQEFYDYTSRPRRTILELLQDFPSVMIPWDRGLFAFPIIRGREFSIANGGKHMTVSPRDDDGCVGWHVEIVVALVEYKTLIRKPRTGLCSRYIKYLPKQKDIVVTVQCATKRTGPPHQLEHAFRPLIAVATGTGIAPIRALIQERDCHHEEQLHRASVPLPKTMLFFGCRGTADYHFWDEWANMLSPVVVIPAFSREPLDPSLRAALAGTGPFNSARLPSDTVTEAQGKLVPHYDSGKNYVQHYIRTNAKAICDLIPDDPIVAICGQSGAMPTSVRLAFLDAFILGGAAKTWAEAELIWQELNPWQETW